MFCFGQPGAYVKGSGVSYCNAIELHLSTEMRLTERLHVVSLSTKVSLPGDVIFFLSYEE